MSNILLWALKIVLAALLLFPFVGVLGTTWINHYFVKKLEHQKKSIELQLEFIRQGGQKQ